MRCITLFMELRFRVKCLAVSQYRLCPQETRDDYEH